MTNDLTIARPAGAMHDIVPPPHVRDTEAILGNRLIADGAAHMITELPTPQQRQRLNERIKDVRALVAPASNSIAAMDRLQAVVLEMLGGHLNHRASADTAVGWVQLLQELPGWAVVQVCEDFKRGAAFEVVNGVEKKLSPDFVPSAPRVYALARAKLDALYAEAELIRRVMSAKLAAPQIPKAEQDRVGAMMRDLSATLTAKDAAERLRHANAVRQQAQEARERAADITAAGDARRLARYAEMGLRPVYGPGNILVEPTLLRDIDRVPVRMEGFDHDRDD